MSPTFFRTRLARPEGERPPRKSCSIALGDMVGTSGTTRKAGLFAQRPPQDGRNAVAVSHSAPVPTASLPQTLVPRIMDRESFEMRREKEERAIRLR